MIILFLISVVLIKAKALYSSGYHRYWHKKQLGIPTKSEIKKLKLNNQEVKNEEINVSNDVGNNV